MAITSDFIDLCRFAAASAGTGSFVVSSAVTGYQTPAQASAVNGATYGYRAENATLTEWEYGIGTYTVGTVTLARTTILGSSNGGAAVNFTAAPQVAIVELSEAMKNASLLTTGTVGTARLGSGTANSGTFLRGDSTWQAVTVPVEATQAEMEAATNTTAFVSPRSFKWSPFAAKAWVKWGVTSTLLASAGVTSITDNAVGDWTVNWSTAFSSANYAVSYMTETTSAISAAFTTSYDIYVKNGGQATGSLRVCTIQNSNNGSSTFSFTDPTSNYVIAFGDQ